MNRDLFKRIKSKWFVIAGVILLVAGVGGTLVSVLDIFAPNLTDFMAWDQSLPAEGFAPIVAPVNPNGADASAPELVITPAPTLAETQPPASGLEETPTPTPQMTPTRPAAVPDRIVMPSIKLDAPVVLSEPSTAKIGGQTYEQFKAPDQFAVGWQTDSALLGQVGNSVFNGHHNVEGKVFENLHNVEPGDTFYIMGGSVQYEYMVVNVMILAERDVEVQTRLENARWIMPSDDERVTLVTCWPAWSNTHRLIVVGVPVGGALPVQTPAPAN